MYNMKINMSSPESPWNRLGLFSPILDEWKCEGVYYPLSHSCITTALEPSEMWPVDPIWLNQAGVNKPFFEVTQVGPNVHGPKGRGELNKTRQGSPVGRKH